MFHIKFEEWTVTPERKVPESLKRRNGSGEERSTEQTERKRKFRREKDLGRTGRSDIGVEVEWVLREDRALIRGK